jgi:hypothetical protein
MATVTFPRMYRCGPVRLLRCPSGHTTRQIENSQKRWEFALLRALRNRDFAGLIDEVRVYNRALSQTEINHDMNTPV